MTDTTAARWPRALACAALLLGCLHPAQARDMKIGLIFDPDDARYDAKRLEKNYPGQPLGRPKAGAEIALAESDFQLGQAKLNITVQELPAENIAAAKAQIEAQAKKGVQYFLLDMPGPAIAELALWMRNTDVILFNVSATDASLRSVSCRANLFHTMPDDNMLADATAQFLTAHKWTKVLLLAGTTSADLPLVAAAQKAAKRYGLKLVATKPYKLSNDPRERDLANVALLTAGVEADVVWVVDADGEFAREVPYLTMLPRPVVGSAGLVAEGWHSSWERNGAPQLNRRFRKSAGRLMASTDWAAWMATKAIIDVALRVPDSRQQRLALRSQDITLDGFKGARLSFRPWDQQLRQPIFLAQGGLGGGIAGVAPFDGFLHQKNNLDTLGMDERESPCKLTDAAAGSGGKK
jgi:ABC transporter substrate binding protein (PQQ-dependent alcohol dehydrogenase system)